MGTDVGSPLGSDDGANVGFFVGYDVGEAVGTGFTGIVKVVTGSCVPSAFFPATVIVKVPVVLAA